MVAPPYCAFSGQWNDRPAPYVFTRSAQRSQSFGKETCAFRHGPSRIGQSRPTVFSVAETRSNLSRGLRRASHGEPVPAWGLRRLDGFRRDRSRIRSRPLGPPLGDQCKARFPEYSDRHSDVPRRPEHQLIVGILRSGCQSSIAASFAGADVGGLVTTSATTSLG